MVIYTLCCALDNTGMSHETNHRFWIPGHTFLPNDRDLGVTETKSGKTSNAKHARVKQTFTVVEMKTPHYKNMQNLQDCTRGEDT